MKDALRNEYERNYRDATIYNEHVAEVNDLCRKLWSNIDRYRDVSKICNVPAVVIGSLHMRESDFNFGTHLFNGDPLTGRTVHEPIGQPERDPENGTSYTWEEGAIAALSYHIREWNIVVDCEWRLSDALYFCETYNGWGYRKFGINSPYLWSYTDKYDTGYFTADGKFDSHIVNQQSGCAPIFKMLGFNS